MDNKLEINPVMSGPGLMKTKRPTFFTPRSQPRPVAEVALGGVVALQHVSVPTLELAHHAVVHVGRHHHPVPRGVRELGALGWDTLGHTAPGPIITDTAPIVTGLELRHAAHCQRLVVT